MSEEPLRTFYVAARLGSLTQAARARHLTPSTVSAQIRALEQQLGAPLFRRHARGVVLTEAGRVALGHAIRILGAYEAMRAEIEQCGAPRPRHRLRLGVTQTTARHFLAAALSRFYAAHPDVEVAVTLCNSARCQRLLQEGMVDLAVVSGPVHLSDDRAQPYFSSRMVAVGPPGALEAGHPVRTSQLLHQRLIVREEGSGTRGALEAALQAQGIRLADWHDLDVLPDTDVIKALVAAGAGQAVLAELVVRREVEAGQLSLAPLDDVDVIQRFFILHRTTGPLVDALVAALHAGHDAHTAGSAKVSVTGGRPGTGMSS